MKLLSQPNSLYLPYPKYVMPYDQDRMVQDQAFFSPVPTNFMGLPETPRTLTAAPPRESPSSLVRIAPEIPTAESKADVNEAAS
mmetsp:Transcript_4779/g.5524  ORF Transcript_4779/g.5524 Transcript_4779/m.5524 type:complete len:84 (-) Transcript_4779:1117-1368(-)